MTNKEAMDSRGMASQHLGKLRDRALLEFGQHAVDTQLFKGGMVALGVVSTSFDIQGSMPQCVLALRQQLNVIRIAASPIQTGVMVLHSLWRWSMAFFKEIDVHQMKNIVDVHVPVTIGDCTIPVPATSNAIDGVGTRSARVMSGQVANWTPFDRVAVNESPPCNWGRLATPTHAQSRGIRILQLLGRFSLSTVPRDETNRDSGDIASLRVVIPRGPSCSATSALTQTKGDSGIFCGHSDGLLTGLLGCHGPGLFPQARVFSLR